jgi:hypothetical protein
VAIRRKATGSASVAWRGVTGLPARMSNNIRELASPQEAVARHLIPRLFENAVERCSQIWHIGEVAVTKILTFEAAQTRDSFMSDAACERLLALPWPEPHLVTNAGRARMSAYPPAIDTPAKQIIVATCFGNGNDRSSWPGRLELHLPFLEDLSAAGFSPESVDAVLYTHMHADHVGLDTCWPDGKWRPTSPSARNIFGKRGTVDFRRRLASNFRGNLTLSARSLRETRAC